MKGSVRCGSVDMAGLTRAEKHGKREDWIGKQRQVRDQKPLYVGGLDLVNLYIEHIDGAKQNKGAKKPVLHFIVRFPPEVLTDEGPTPYAERDRTGREKLMVRQAVKFINENHGGQAVFSARLDRDEVGETIVDVFACPRYMKPSRSGRREPTLWTSATKFGEELARKHQDHTKTRMTGAETVKPITSPRAVGTLVVGIASVLAAFHIAFNFSSPMAMPVMAFWAIGMFALGLYSMRNKGFISVLIFIRMVAIGLVGVFLSIPWIIGVSMVISKGGVSDPYFLPALLWGPVYFGIPGLMACAIKSSL